MGFWKRAGTVAINMLNWTWDAIESLPDSQMVKNSIRNQERYMERFDRHVSNMEKLDNSQLVKIARESGGMEQSAAAKVLKDRGIIK